MTGTICAYKCYMIRAWPELYCLTTWLVMLWQMINSWYLAPIYHSYRYMAFGMGQCMNATISKDSSAWCMMQPDVQHDKDLAA
jgi:hypothetical protein